MAGTDFKPADQMFFGQVVEAAAGEDLRQAAAVNPANRFELVLKNLLGTLFIERTDQNEEISMRFIKDKSFQKIFSAGLASEAYQKLRAVPPRP